MSNEEKSIHIIKFWERKLIGKKFLFHGKWKGCKKLLVSTGATPGVDKITKQEEYESALEGNGDINKNDKTRLVE